MHVASAPKPRETSRRQSTKVVVAISAVLGLELPNVMSATKEVANPDIFVNFDSLDLLSIVFSDGG